jgi:HSP20 family molecular chaperone IbpA
MDRMMRNWENQMMAPSLSRLPSRVFTEATEFIPAIDVADEERQVVVLAELPGTTKDRIRVNIEGDQLVISGRIVKERGYGGTSERNWKIRERPHGSVRTDLISDIFTDFYCSLNVAFICHAILTPTR